MNTITVKNGITYDDRECVVFIDGKYKAFYIHCIFYKGKESIANLMHVYRINLTKSTRHDKKDNPSWIYSYSEKVTKQVCELAGVI